MGNGVELHISLVPDEVAIGTPRLFTYSKLETLEEFRVDEVAPGICFRLKYTNRTGNPDPAPLFIN